MLASKSVLVAVIAILGCIVRSQAAEPVLLQYRLAKGDTLVYKTAQEQKLTQTILNNKTVTASKHDTITIRTVNSVDALGTATLKTRAERRMVRVGDYYSFDSKSSERDTTSTTGAAITPLLERLTGSDYQVLVSTRGAVLDVKGYIELIGDLAKDNPVAQQVLGAGGGQAAAQIAEQEAFVVLSEKRVSPGDQWEIAFETDLEGVGKVKGKVIYVYEGDDKVKDRKTIRIGVTTDVTIDLKFEAGGAKVSGTLSTSSATGTVQFDPQAGRVISSKRSIAMSGQLTVEAGGMVIPLDHQSEDTNSMELIDRIPE